MTVRQRYDEVFLLGQWHGQTSIPAPPSRNPWTLKSLEDDESQSNNALQLGQTPIHKRDHAPMKVTGDVPAHEVQCIAIGHSYTSTAADDESRDHRVRGGFNTLHSKRGEFAILVSQLNGKAYAVGEGSHGQLGILPPRLAPGGDSVSSGTGSSIVPPRPAHTDSSGAIHSSHTFRLPSPQPVPFFFQNRHTITKVSCGQHHSAFLTNAGRLFTTGLATYGRLGLGPVASSSSRGPPSHAQAMKDVVWTPKEVLVPCMGEDGASLQAGHWERHELELSVQHQRDEAIRRARAAARAAREATEESTDSHGEKASKALDATDGRPLSANYLTGIHGERMADTVDMTGFEPQRHPELSNSASSGTRVVLRERPSVWLDVECGDRFTICISGPLDGVVDRTTESVTEPVALSFQDLGQGDPQEEEKHPVRAWQWDHHAGTPLRPPLVRVWAAGDSTDGRLGAGLSGDAHTPLALPYFSRNNQIAHGVPVSISVGRSHTLLLTHTGCTFSWGMGRYGQLGHGCREDEYAPRHITHSGFARLVIRHVSAGTRHSLALDSHRRLWVWGHSGNGRLGLPPAGWQYTSPDKPPGGRGGASAPASRDGATPPRPKGAADREAANSSASDSDDYDEEMYGRYGIKQRSDERDSEVKLARKKRQDATGEALYSALTGGRSNAAGYRASLSMRDEEEAYETTGRSGRRRRKVDRLNGMAMLSPDWDTTQDVLFPVQWQAMPEHPLGEAGVFVESIDAGHAGSAIVDSLGRLFVTGHNALCEMGTRDTLDRYVFTHVRTFDTEAYATGNRQFNETVGGPGARSPGRELAPPSTDAAPPQRSTKHGKKHKRKHKHSNASAMQAASSFRSVGTGVHESAQAGQTQRQEMQRQGSKHGPSGMLKRPPSWGGLSFASATSGPTGRVQLGGVAAVLAQNRAHGEPAADIARAAAAAAQGLQTHTGPPRPPQQAAKKWSLSTREKRAHHKSSRQSSRGGAGGGSHLGKFQADTPSTLPWGGGQGQDGQRSAKAALVPGVKMALCGPSFTLVVIIVQQRTDSAAARAAALAAAEQEAEAARAVLERRFLGSAEQGQRDSESSSGEAGSSTGSDSDLSRDLSAPFKQGEGGWSQLHAPPGQGSSGYDHPLAGTATSVLSAAETAANQLAAADSAVRKSSRGTAILPGVDPPPTTKPHVPPLKLNLTAPAPQDSDDDEALDGQNADRERASLRVFRPLHAALADQAARDKAAGADMRGAPDTHDMPLYQLGEELTARQVPPPPAGSTNLSEGDFVPSKTEYYRWLLASQTPDVPSVEHPSAIQARKERLRRMRRQLNKQQDITAGLLSAQDDTAGGSRAAQVDKVLSRGGVSEYRATAPAVTSVSSLLASGGALRSVSGAASDTQRSPMQGGDGDSSSDGEADGEAEARSRAAARSQAGSYDPLQSTEDTNLETILAQRRQRFLKREEVVTQLDLRRMYDGRLYKDQQEAIMIAMLNRFDRNAAREGMGGGKSSTQPINPGGPSLQQVMVEAMRETGGAPSSVRGRMARSYARQALESTAEVQDWKIDPRGVAETVQRQQQLEQWATHKWQRPDAHQGMDLARTKWSKIIKSRGGYSWRPPEDPTDVAMNMHPVLGNWGPKAGQVPPVTARVIRSNKHSPGTTFKSSSARASSDNLPKRRSMGQRLDALRRSRDLADTAGHAFDLGPDAEFEEEGVVLDKKGFVVLRGGQYIVDGVHLPADSVPEDLKHQPHLLRRFAQSVAFARSNAAQHSADKLSSGAASPARGMRVSGHMVSAALSGFGYKASPRHGGAGQERSSDTAGLQQLAHLSASVSPRDMLQRRQWSTRKHARTASGGAEEAIGDDTASRDGGGWRAALATQPPGSPASANRHDASMLQRTATAYGGYDALENLIEDASAGLLGSSLLPGDIPTASAAASAGAVAAAGLNATSRHRARDRMGDAENAAMRLVDQRLESAGQLSPASSQGGERGGGVVEGREMVKRSASRRLSSYTTAVHKLPPDELQQLVLSSVKERLDTAAPLAPPSPVETRFHHTPAFKATAAASPAARRVPPSVVMSLHRYALPAGIAERRTGAHAAAAGRLMGGTDLPSTHVPMVGGAYDESDSRADDTSDGLAFDWQGPRGGDADDVHLPRHLQAVPDEVRDYNTLKAKQVRQGRGMAPSGSASSLISEATGPTSSLTYLSSSDKATHAAEQAVLLVRAAKEQSPYFKKPAMQETKEA